MTKSQDRKSANVLRNENILRDALAIVAILAIIGMVVFAIICGTPALAATCTRVAPILWPHADFPLTFDSNCHQALDDYFLPVPPGSPPGTQPVHHIGVPLPLDSGAIRADANGCLEVLHVGGPDPGYSWAPWSPADITQANYFARYGRCQSRGHFHHRDGEVNSPIEWYAAICNSAAQWNEGLCGGPFSPAARAHFASLNSGSMEVVDLYYSTRFYALRAAFFALNPADPQPSPTPSPSPTASPCDGVCQAADATRCPADCPVVQPSPQPSPTPTVCLTCPPLICAPCPVCLPPVACPTYEAMPDSVRSTLLSWAYWPKPWTAKRQRAADEANAWARGHKGAWSVKP